MPDPISVVSFGTDGFEGGSESFKGDIVKQQEARVFHRAVVIETICDPSKRLAVTPLSLSSGSLDAYKTAPRNSVVARLITDNNDSNDADVVCFPFFSSHLALPVKPGEQVWVITEELFNDPRNSRCYWLSRVPGQLALEDANFTGFSRNTGPFGTEPTKPEERKIDYPNDAGAGIDIIGAPDDFPDDVEQDTSGLLRDVMTNAIEAAEYVIEPVPRITKRPGDFIIQGSNNTAIIMGTESGFDFVTRPESRTTSISSEASKDASGAIDVVVGRGRYFEETAEEIKKARDKPESAQVKNSTAPLIVQNALEKFETDKNPVSTLGITDFGVDEDGRPSPEENKKKDAVLYQNAITNPSEGDQDFVVDASRVYVAEKSAVDVKFGLDQIIAAPFSEGEAVDTSAGVPCIALKTDHVRIVARKVPLDASDSLLPAKATEAGVTNGSIRIVKEGKPDEDLAVIYIEPDGTIQISGSKIFLGRQEADGGRGKGPGPSAEEPYVRYSDLEKLWQDTMAALDEFCQTLSTHVTPGYGAPSPQINQAAEALKSTVANLKTQIEEVKSERIFGE